MTNQLTVSLNISYDEFEVVYRGSAKHVFANTMEGKSMRFPADILKPFLTRDGIQGLFRVKFDADHKFAGIYKI